MGNRTCNDLLRSEHFYARLGFINANPGQGYDGYLILEDGKGGRLHPAKAEPEWLILGRNPFGLYSYTEAVDELATRFGEAVIGGPEHKPWGMYEFALNDPNETLIRVACIVGNDSDFEAIPRLTTVADYFQSGCR